MRIISGKYKGKKLDSPADAKTHPMGERERNAIFNSLGDINGLEVLDLFAGTGALGLEALSRGAKSVLFLEKSFTAVNTLRKNVALLAPPLDSVKITKQDVSSWAPDQAFDLVFCDPPYSLAPSLDFSFLSACVAEAGRLVLSVPKTFTPILPDFLLLSDKTYAACRIIICKRKNNML